MKGYRSYFAIIPLVILFAFVLAACGSNPGSTTTGSGGDTTPTSSSTTTTGHATSVYGCPAGIVSNPPQGTPNVIVQPMIDHAVVSAHKGDLIEIRLPFGQQWASPSMVHSILQLQTPSGYVSTANKACIWRFVATDSGTEQLNFFARAICLKGAVCPMYVMRIPVTIDVN
jgi:predicted small secreted protein